MGVLNRGMEGSRQLEAAPAPPLHRARRFRRVVLLVVLCALVYPGGGLGRGCGER